MKNRYRQLYVFYAPGMCFNGDADKYRALGSSESALLHLSREIAKAGKKVIIFSAGNNPGVYANVRYEKSSKFQSFAARNIFDVFISVECGDVFRADIKAGVKSLWLLDRVESPALQVLNENKIRSSIDYILSVSDSQSVKISREYKWPKEKIIESSIGFSLPDYKVLRGKRKQRIVYTSSPYRGLDFLLDVFPEVRKVCPNAELAVYAGAGKNGMDKEKEVDAYSSIYERCSMPGVRLERAVPHKHLAKELMQARVLAYPNMIEEASCSAAVEAQAAGVPVVGFKNQTLLDTVADENKKYLVSTLTDEKKVRRRFIRNLTDLLTDTKEWTSASQAARDYALSSFDWKNIAAEMMAFFGERLPKLSVCMIVKDEEEFIEMAVKSVRHVADEVIVVDTGSQDRSCYLAANAGARVFEYAWNDDFSAARNYALDKAGGDWVFVMDADECLSLKDSERMRRYINVRVADAFCLFQRSYLNDSSVAGWRPNEGEYEEGMQYNGYFEVPIVRLFKNRVDYRFEGKVHELIEPSIRAEGGTILNTDIRIQHFGKVRAAKRVYAKAEKYLSLGEQKVSEVPGSVSALFELAVQYFELGKYDKAREYYEKVIKNDPTHHRAYCDMSAICINENEWEKAREYAEEALRLNPGFFYPKINLGLVSENKGDYQEARKLFEEVVSAQPQNVFAIEKLMRLDLIEERFSSAERRYSQLLQICKDTEVKRQIALAYYEAGIKKMEKGEPENALKLFLLAVKADSSLVPAHNNLGILAMQSGDFDRAEACFKKTIEVGETDESYIEDTAKACVNLGFLYNNKGEYKEALSVLSQAIVLDDRNAEAYNHSGIAYCGLGDLSKGAGFFEKALRVRPDHASALTNLSRVKEVLVREYNYSATGSAEKKMSTERI